MIGRRAPEFALTASDGNIYSLKELLRKKIVLVFYVINNTPG